jgi:1,4-dihydroxy-2-naphthoate octaprenyltransferase
VLCLGAALFAGAHYLIPIPHECTIYDNAGGGGENNIDVGSSSSAAVVVMDGRNHYDPVMMVIVLSSVFNAVAYTGGPFPLGHVGLGHVSIGYTGLGDIFVFIYFGIVATIGVPYMYLTKISCLHAHSSSSTSGILLWQLLRPSFLHSIPIGLLATAIIVMNNLRDRHTDVRAGKRTLAVRYGETFARAEYILLLLGSYTFCIMSYFWERRRDEREDMAWTALLPLVSFPMAIPQLQAVAFGQKDGQALNDHVGGTARLQLVYCILMATGLIIS